MFSKIFFYLIKNQLMQLSLPTLLYWLILLESVLSHSKQTCAVAQVDCYYRNICKHCTRDEYATVLFLSTCDVECNHVCLHPLHDTFPRNIFSCNHHNKSPSIQIENNIHKQVSDPFQ